MEAKQSPSFHPSTGPHLGKTWPWPGEWVTLFKVWDYPGNGALHCTFGISTLRTVGEVSHHPFLPLSKLGPHLSFGRLKAAGR